MRRFLFNASCVNRAMKIANQANIRFSQEGNDLFVNLAQALAFSQLLTEERIKFRTRNGNIVHEHNARPTL